MRGNARCCSSLGTDPYLLPVSGPLFAPLCQEVIQAFTAPGDLVVDPFMGGGTTLVEATALGRRAVGTDISALAAFIARVKTTLYTDAELRHLETWIDRVEEQINIHCLAVYPADWVNCGYRRHLETKKTWRLTKAIQQALASAGRLPTRRVEDFARCVVLRTAQWALDARKKIPSVQEFRSQLREFARKMLAGSDQYRHVVEQAFSKDNRPEPLCLNRTGASVGQDTCVAKTAPAEAHSNLTSVSGSSREVVLIHRKRADASMRPAQDQIAQFDLFISQIG